MSLLSNPDKAFVTKGLLNVVSHGKDRTVKEREETCRLNKLLEDEYPALKIRLNEAGIERVTSRFRKMGAEKRKRLARLYQKYNADAELGPMITLLTDIVAFLDAANKEPPLAETHENDTETEDKIHEESQHAADVPVPEVVPPTPMEIDKPVTVVYKEADVDKIITFVDMLWHKYIQLEGMREQLAREQLARESLQKQFENIILETGTKRQAESLNTEQVRNVKRRPDFNSAVRHFCGI